ncbi:phosphoglycerate mutase family protein [Desulfoluna butyratoxydans]|uniref:Phosphoglycerate mutase family protein n=1 Tax=Desulfoluna butyratoxydans TaxID=231438 RepID=A0A4U8YN32_9BACT|nr:phosphoglycerate mutase family protein [Desulfoluna butyratoxydans]VFQ44589.1 hypothetical protein MSL71_22380 [Desulfoluna butyratoxydans]
MERILQTAESMQQKARAIIEDTQLMDIWTSIGATINLVGSLQTGLLINNRDIDFHIYSAPFSLSDSFSAMARLAENPRIKSISYTNLIEAEDKCIEWHAFYEDEENQSWQIDMIHILEDSPYVGYFERVAERISQVLTPETRQAILTIKDAIPPEKKVMGIQIYKAVIADGVRDVDAFWHWKDAQPDDGIVTWVP